LTRWTASGWTDSTPARYSSFPSQLPYQSIRHGGPEAACCHDHNRNGHGDRAGLPQTPFGRYCIVVDSDIWRGGLHGPQNAVAHVRAFVTLFALAFIIAYADGSCSPSRRASSSPRVAPTSEERSTRGCSGLHTLSFCPPYGRCEGSPGRYSIHDTLDLDLPVPTGAHAAERDRASTASTAARTNADRRPEATPCPPRVSLWSPSGEDHDRPDLEERISSKQSCSPFSDCSPTQTCGTSLWLGASSSRVRA
jgi:hypothetical protein